MADAADNSQEATVTTDGDISRDNLAEPKKDDPPRKKRGRPPGSKNKTGLGDSTDTGKSKAWIQKKLTALLVSPAFAFEAIGEQWPKQHIDNAGPNLAKAIADKADRDPALKIRLEQFLQGGESATLIFSAAMYVLPLGIYFGIIPAPERLRLMLAIPERGGSAAVEMPNIDDPQMQQMMQNEAEAHGFQDLDEYMRAVQAAAQEVKGPGVFSGGK